MSSSCSSPSSSFSFTSCLTIMLLLILYSTSAICADKPHRQLSVDYYAKSCPQLEQLIGSITSQQFKEEPISGPATIRLFFHDCFVEGCDASITIKSKQGSKMLAEKDAPDNKDLREEGFESVRKAKALVESKCPGLCLVLTYLQLKPEIMSIWQGVHTIKLRRGGLTLEDLVVLSGAHTFGYAHCQSFESRLYDYRGSKQPDPLMDPRLLRALRMSCPHYEAKLGLLASDQALALDPRTKPIVQAYAKDKAKFFQAFGVAMEKMGSIGVKRGRKHGEKRKDCSMHM
ncbi:hypothetical protein M0R45_013349 [Rubus argutus]|uniref:Peroxidase n=1 Tax=Rubus argutus TaxID=59490 RepID=A0AAW1XKX2_RUBAR